MTSANQPVKTGIKPLEIKKIQAYLVNAVTRDLEANAPPAGISEKEAFERIAQVYSKTGLVLPDTLQRQIIRSVYDEIWGYGPIQVLLDDPLITEIMVNGPSQVYIERGGKILKTNASFENDQHILRLIDRIVLPLGRRIDADHPTVDARLPDGSRVNAVIPPVAIDGPSITIRKFSKEKLTVERLIEYGSFNTHLA